MPDSVKLIRTNILQIALAEFLQIIDFSLNWQVSMLFCMFDVYSNIMYVYLDLV